MGKISILGPQRHRPTVGDAVQHLRREGPLVSITAGWQEREAEVQELDEHLGVKTRHLALYQRHEAVLRQDRDLAHALAARQEKLRKLQRYYRIRLDYTLGAARDLLSRKDDGPVLEGERTAAIEAVRTLDAHHLECIRAIRADFEKEWAPTERPAVVRERERFLEKMSGAAAVLIAGGHVAVLFNRLQLFGFGEWLEDLPIIAWSAGAMALSEKLVLFHDLPPQGQGNAEIFDVGLGLHHGVVPLPGARHRLKLSDRTRVSLFARRFQPALSVAMDEGSRMDWDETRWIAGPETYLLLPDGQVQDMGAVS